MITKEEVIRSNESYTKKDFVQIYNEIVDLATKISERWTPQSTNESDPMIVLMKLLAFIGDKNNYYIDKRTNEVYMPSVTQIENMRKLCDLFGYNVKYIQSGESTITMSYVGSELPKLNDTSATANTIMIPKYTQITNEDGNIVYTTLEEVLFTYRNQVRTTKIIQGVKQEIDVNGVNCVKTSNLDDNLRYYLPISGVAENGIIVRYYTTSTTSEGQEWKKVNNLNEQPYKSLVWKFGYDSNKRCPYIQFPEDVASIIGNGVSITYFISDGVQGNVSAKTLNKFVNDSIYDYQDRTESSWTPKKQTNDDGASRLVMYNSYAITNGAEEQSIDEIYNDYKKTVGTFDTLVTCRDYINKIYYLMNDNGKYLVGNIDVGDKRTDINKSLSILTFDAFGIHYNTQSTQTTTSVDDINCFDLYLYPLSNIGDSINANSYQNSFKPNYSNNYLIENQLEDCKTLCHNIKYVTDNELYMYKDLYNLNAKVVTMSKVNAEEQQSIINNIYYALMKNFNSRNVDIGTEINYDDILSVMEKADERIKFVSLEEPTHTINVMRGSGTETGLLEADTTTQNRNDYLDTIARNVLAGRVDLFNYEGRVDARYGQHNTLLIGGGSLDSNKVVSLQPRFEITNINSNPTTPITLNYTLRSNEMIQCISPKLTGDVDALDGSSSTFVYTVNYYWRKGAGTPVQGDKLSANKTYKLETDDVLYVDYTDGNNIQWSIKYYNSSGTYSYDKYKNKVLVSTGTWEGYICPNFELESSYWVIRVPAKKVADLPAAWENEMPNSVGTYGTGMQQFSYSDELQLQKKSETNFTDNRNVYWLVNDSTNKINWTITGSGANAVGTYILEDGEYFMMTDEGKNDLIIFSSGTKLETKYNVNDTSVWTLSLNNENTISAEDVANYGLGAFSDTQWKYMKFTTTNYFKIAEMNTLNLVEGDVIKTIKATTDPTDKKLDYQFHTLTSMTFTCDDVDDTLASQNDITWQIRTRLILNVTPTIYQLLPSDFTISGSGSSAKKSKQSLTYTFKDSTSSTSHTGTISNCYFNTTYSIYSILDNISVKTIDVFGKYNELDNFTIYKYSYTEPNFYDNSTTPVSLDDKCLTKLFDDNHYQIEFNASRQTAHLRVPKLDSNDTAIFMIYYNTSSSSVATAPTVYGVNNNNIKKFYDTSVSTSITLTKGINIILMKLDGTSSVIDEIVINRGSEYTGTFILSMYKILKTTNPLNSTYVNNETSAYNSVFGLLSTPSTPESETLRNKLVDYDYKEIFYYGATLSNELLINISKSSEELLSDTKFVYDNNNIINRHLIPELNVESFKNIEISKSSQL